ncbi:MAG: hypothetical protein E5W57_21050 [Mesorhizobium sp.]|nr:MAG: hypothetical protein E5W57_21050 [Mesorhizobium sp.]
MDKPAVEMRIVDRKPSFWIHSSKDGPAIALTNQCSRIGYADAPWNSVWRNGTLAGRFATALYACGTEPSVAWSPPMRVTIARAGCFAANNQNRYTQNGSMRQFTAADEIRIVRDGNDNHELVMASR